MLGVYTMSVGFARGWYSVLAQRQLSNREAVPRSGPLIVASNHLSSWDPTVLAATIPRPITFMAKEELFRTPWGWLIFNGLGAIPVNRGRSNLRTFRQAEGALAKGKVLCLFPEGSRSREAALLPGQVGIAYLALSTGASVLPVGITGTEKIPTILHFITRPTVTVNIGEVIPVSKSPGATDRGQLVELTSLIMTKIAELLPPEYRGVYG
ncbi:MAG: 1-acyl-sn-glycerol-3-phosphate acyltransferase [Dehalococcoidia bacterium]|nr:1-acyl-sn-glycerol-3-phosphate acyltransferase [Dehalococcoidia bacterium]